MHATGPRRGPAPSVRERVPTRPTRTWWAAAGSDQERRGAAGQETRRGPVADRHTVRRVGGPQDRRRRRPGDRGGDLAARLRVEAIAGEQRVRPLAALPRVRDAGKRARIPGEQPSAAIRSGATATHHRQVAVRREPRVARAAVDDRPVDALQAQLSRSAISPRGRARSRDSIQARANAASSSIPSSARRAIAPSTSSAR